VGSDADEREDFDHSALLFSSFERQATSYYLCISVVDANNRFVEIVRVSKVLGLLKDQAPSLIKISPYAKLTLVGGSAGAFLSIDDEGDNFP
jgi:hypothetical protein